MRFFGYIILSMGFVVTGTSLAQTTDSISYEAIEKFVDPDVRTGQNVVRLTAISENGEVVAYSVDDDIVKILSLESLELIGDVELTINAPWNLQNPLNKDHAAYIDQIALSKDGTYTFGGVHNKDNVLSNSLYLLVIDNQSVEIIAQVDLPTSDPADRVSSVVVSPDGKWLAVGYAQQIVLFEVETLAEGTARPVATLPLVEFDTGPVAHHKSRHTNPIISDGENVILGVSSRRKFTRHTGWRNPSVRFSTESTMLYAMNMNLDFYNVYDDIDHWLELMSWTINNGNVTEHVGPFRVDNFEIDLDNVIITDGTLYAFDKGDDRLWQVDLSTTTTKDRISRSRKAIHENHQELDGVYDRTATEIGAESRVRPVILRPAEHSELWSHSAASFKYNYLLTNDGKMLITPSDPYTERSIGVKIGRNQVTVTQVSAVEDEELSPSLELKSDEPAESTRGYYSIVANSDGSTIVRRNDYEFFVWNRSED